MSGDPRAVIRDDETDELYLTGIPALDRYRALAADLSRHIDSDAEYADAIGRILADELCALHVYYPSFRRTARYAAAELADRLEPQPDLDSSSKRARLYAEILIAEVARLEIGHGLGTALHRPATALARTASRAADLAGRALPAAHRARYREEYRSELYELVATGTPRWRQMLFALRLLACSWVLRTELRPTNPRRARS